MAEATIPVDLFNPGQVFACLGFLEAADVLLGNAQGGFDWSRGSASFSVKTHSDECPLNCVLDFLANAEVQEICPIGWPNPLLEGGAQSEVFPSPLTDHCEGGEAKTTKLPIRLIDSRSNTKTLEIQHWTDGSSRSDFKLYAGNRSGASIARDMLTGKKSTPNRKHPRGKQLTLGVCQLWETEREKLLENPFALLTEMGGSFNFDARGAWSPIDAGYSPDAQGHRLRSSPIVEILAAIGLEHFRPSELELRSFGYSVWQTPIPPQLARAVMPGSPIPIPTRSFQFYLRLSGKNKIVSFSEDAGAHPLA